MEEKPKSKRALFITVIVAVLLIAGGIFIYLNQGKILGKKETKAQPKYSAYRMTGNGLQKLDFYFMQLENKEENKVYSPLSIKYALEMLAEGAQGKTKENLDAIIGEYVARKYTNSKNMSFANALFINENKKDEINQSYSSKLQDKYNAEVIYDSFANANNINTWVKNRTFSLIKDLVDDSVKDKDFAILNALAIDMEWIQTLQGDKDHVRDYSVFYPHQEFYQYIGSIGVNDVYGEVKFNDKMDAKTVKVAAAINRYDIINKLGESNIRKTVTDDYTKWYNKNGEICKAPTPKEYVDNYIKEIGSGYKRVDSSTDFTLYDDDEVKAFAKDLKTYDGTTLQYVGIMPKQIALTEYVKNIDIQKVNNVINNLKEIKLDNFKDGVVTSIEAQIPLFNFEYALNLKEDLKQLGVGDIFDLKTANLRGISSSNAYIDSASHKAKIDFSNTGIQASAATALIGGLGNAAECEYDYTYEPPVEKLDLTFDKPYLFLIRDKNTGEVWFTGTVFTPDKADKNQFN